MPAAPHNTSPVPELTSLHGTQNRGPWGNASYRGNCDGYLINKLLRYFDAKRVLDPMSGSGTCREVCEDLNIEHETMDVRHGQDAADPEQYRSRGTFDFIWMHPPYWRQIVYSADPRCLSNAPTLESFGDRLQSVLQNSKSVLAPGGRIAVLIGGYSDRGTYQPLPAVTIQRAEREGLRMACTEIVRLQHGNTSSRRTYQSSFIPGLHDQCLIFESRDASASRQAAGSEFSVPRGRLGRARTTNG